MGSWSAWREGEAVEHFAHALGRGDLWSLAQPAQLGSPPQLGVDLDQLIQARALVNRQWVQEPVLHAALSQTLHTPDETLQRGHARRDDLLGPQALDAGLDEWQRPIAFQRQRQQLLPDGVELWPAAILKAELTPQLVEVLEDGVVAFAVLLEDGWVNVNLLSDVLDDTFWYLGHVGECAAGKSEQAEVDGEAQTIGGSTMATDDLEVAVRQRIEATEVTFGQIGVHAQEGRSASDYTGDDAFSIGNRLSVAIDLPALVAKLSTLKKSDVNQPPIVIFTQGFAVELLLGCG